MTTFLADENVSRLVIDKLRQAGFDVLSVAETKAGFSDRDIVATAEADRRVLITEDRDFGELLVRQKMGILGLVLLELDRLPKHLLVIEPARTRIRQLVV